MAIYRPVVHDGVENFEMERQIFLLAKAGALVWKEWAQQNMVVHGPDHKPTLFESYMRDLYHQLDKTDIFMGGYHAARNQQ